MRIAHLTTLLLLACPMTTSAQLLAARDNPIAYGHHHVNASDIESHKRFWIDGLGGESVAIGGSSAEAVRFPNVLVLLRDREPTGGTIGSVVNHVGFEVRDVDAVVHRLRDLGFQMITRRELPAAYEVRDDVAQRAGGNRIAFVLGPDGTKVEMLENPSIEHPIQLHHVHWAVPDGEAMQAWYVEHFGATPGTRIGQPTGELPGVNLTFGPSGDGTVVPTQGRALDHIGFEVQDLRAMIRRLEDGGVVMDRGYTEVPSMGIAIAFLTDPWGTYIELTEGLADVE